MRGWQQFGRRPVRGRNLTTLGAAVFVAVAACGQSGQPAAEPEDPAPQPPPAKTASAEDEQWSPELYEEICRQDVPETHDQCRQRLSHWSEHLAWFDRRMLARSDRPLQAADLDQFYGFLDDRARASRKVVLAFLAAWCHQGADRGALTEDQILSSPCARRLPTLATLGLSIDQSVEDILIGDHDYAGIDSASTEPFDDEEND